MTSNELSEPPTTALRTVARLALSGVLVLAGLSHLFGAREDFQAQVPRSIPLDPDGVLMASAGVEIMPGAGLAVLTRPGANRTDHRRILHRSFPGKHRPIPQQAGMHSSSTPTVAGSSACCFSSPSSPGHSGPPSFRPPTGAQVRSRLDDMSSRGAFGVAHAPEQIGDVGHGGQLNSQVGGIHQNSCW